MLVINNLTGYSFPTYRSEPSKFSPHSLIHWQPEYRASFHPSRFIKWQAYKLPNRSSRLYYLTQHLLTHLLTHLRTLPISSLIIPTYSRYVSIFILSSPLPTSTLYWPATSTPLTAPHRYRGK